MARPTQSKKKSSTGKGGGKNRAPAARFASSLEAAERMRRPKSPAVKPRRGYAGRSAEQLRIERMNRLLEAGLSLFSSRGYAKTPIEMICAQARVTTRHFYEQYVGREALLEDLYQQILAGTRKVVLEAFQQPDLGIEQRVHAAIHAFIGSYTDDPRRARVACIEVVGVSDEITQMRRKLVGEFATTLENLIRAMAKDSTLPQRDYHLGAVCVIGGTNELMAEWLTSAQPPSVPQLTEQLLRFYSALLAGVRLLGDKTPSFDLGVAR